MLASILLVLKCYYDPFNHFINAQVVSPLGTRETAFVHSQGVMVLHLRVDVLHLPLRLLH